MDLFLAVLEGDGLTTCGEGMLILPCGVHTTE